MEMPPLSEAELALLRESIERDGVKYPVLFDRSGDIIDGFNRQRITAELGIDCPTKKLNVDKETADRLRLTLNLARRHMTTLDQHELLASLAEKHWATAAAEAKDRQGQRTDLNIQDTVSSKSGRAKQTRDVVAERINKDLADMGEKKRVTGKTVERAQATVRLPEATKKRVRNGEVSLNSVHPYQAGPRKGTATATKPKKEVPEHVAAQARIRAIDAERKYESMINAPTGKLNLPFLDRASKMMGLLIEITALTPEKAVSGIPAMRCREFAGEFSAEMAQWWVEFVDLCEKRRLEETPDLVPVHKRNRLGAVNPVLGDSATSPTVRAVLDWAQKQTEPFTAAQVALGLRAKKDTVGLALRELTKSGQITATGRVDNFILYELAK